jgi:protein gp37
MGDKSAIEWCEATWNPTTGCDRISPGCDHCYALTLAARLKAMGQTKYQTDGRPPTSGPGFGLAVHHDAVAEPLKWRTPRLVFVNSMSDLFHARVPVDFIAEVWAVMAATPQHTYQVLTKRPERYAKVLNGPCGCSGGHLPGIHFRSRAQSITRLYGREVDLMQRWPLPNVWLGTSIESDEFTRRADALRTAPASVRFLSLEPLLGPLPSLDLTGIDWAIVGGESGPGARPMDLAWARDLVQQCRAVGVAPFVKQLGAHPYSGGLPWLCRSAKGGDISEFPPDLQVRECPR